MRFAVLCLATTIVFAMALLPRVILAQNHNAYNQDTLAAVNGSPITRRDIEKEKQLLNAALALDSRGDLNEQGQDGISDSELLDLLIDRELIVQQAMAQNIKIHDRHVNDVVASLKNRIGDLAGYKQHLVSVGLTEDQLVDHYRTGLILKHYLQSRVIYTVRVSEAELNSFYSRHPEDFMRPNQVRALHLLVAVADEEQRGERGGRGEALIKIQEIQLKLMQGADFGTIALENSDCPSRTKGGDLGYFTSNQIIGPVADVAFTLQPGQTSHIVESSLGYHLIKVIDRKPPSRIAFKDVRQKIEHTIRRNKENQALSRHLAGLRKEAEIIRSPRMP